MFIKSHEFNRVKLFYPNTYKDNRGTYSKFFDSDLFGKSNFSFEMNELSVINAKKDSFRGLHIQLPNPQAKFLIVNSGKILDFCLDLRKDSKTFCKYFSIELSSQSNCAIFIPEGFAHGFLALEDSVITYLSNKKYESNNSISISYADSDLNIQLPIKDLILSEKDRTALTLKDFLSKNL